MNKKQRRLFLNQNGMGMIEAMMMVGIMLAIISGVMMNSNIINSRSANIKSQMGSQSLQSTLNQVMGNNTLCINHLTSKSFGPTQQAAATNSGMPLSFTLDDGTSVTAGATPVPLNPYSVSVDKFLLKMPAPLASIGVDAAGNSQYQGAVLLDLNKLSGLNAVAGGSRLPEMNMGAMTISVDAGNNIVSCQLNNTSVANSCAQMGGTFIPTANPPCKLPTPCAPPSIFVGYNPNGTANCLTCAANQCVSTNASGVSSCVACSGNATPTPGPTAGPAAGPTANPSATPSGCSAGVSGNCQYPSAGSGSSAPGTCVAPTTGTCSITCSGGTVTVFGSCTNSSTPTPTPTTAPSATPVRMSCANGQGTLHHGFSYSCSGPRGNCRQNPPPWYKTAGFTDLTQPDGTCPSDPAMVLTLNSYCSENLGDQPSGVGTYSMYWVCF